MAPKSRKMLISVFVIAFLGIVASVLLRNSLLNWLIERNIKQLENKYPVNIEIKQAVFSGLNTVIIQGITIVPDSVDTLFTTSDIQFNIRLSSLLRGNIRLNGLLISNATVNLIKHSGVNNYSFLFQKEVKDTLTRPVRALGKRYNDILNLLFDVVPASVNLQNLALNYRTDSLNYTLEVPLLKIRDYNFETDFLFNDGIASYKWKGNGFINSPANNFDIHLFRTDIDTTPFYLFKNDVNLAINCDTVAFSLTELNYDEEVLTLIGQISAHNLLVRHWRISPKKVLIDNAALDYKINIGKNYYEIDSGSIASINKIKLHPWLFLQKEEQSKKYSIAAHIPTTSSQVFFNSLPHGLFTNFEDIKSSGELNYRLYFQLDESQPDSLMFSSKLTADHFKILEYGETNFAKINGEFLHTVYEKGNPVRSFNVGPSNPFYTPIDQISEFLKASILISEDGSFYYHQGFNEEMFAKSIATNYKEKRFVRGGSTISMQLIKNLFLTRNKTIARKVEEALIVWLIESNRLVSKVRMYEVYLNIIEWGPGIFGIGEASKFYFDKDPSALTLNESIFLAMIVPQPKGFRYQFDETGKLKEHTLAYYKVIAGHLLKKGLITEMAVASLNNEIQLKGDALNMVVKAVPDSVITNMVLPDEDF